MVVHCLGQKIVDYVFLSMDDAENSKCQLLGTMIDDDQLEESMLDAVCFNLAGKAADCCYFRDEMPAEPLPGWGQDIVDARGLAEMVAGNRGMTDDDPGLPDAVDEIIATQQRRADAFVRSNWPAVNAIVAELLDRKRVPGDEVHAIIDRELGRLAG